MFDPMNPAPPVTKSIQICRAGILVPSFARDRPPVQCARRAMIAGPAPLLDTIWQAG